VLPLVYWPTRIGSTGNAIPMPTMSMNTAMKTNHLPERTGTARRDEDSASFMGAIERADRTGQSTTYPLIERGRRGKDYVTLFSSGARLREARAGLLPRPHRDLRRGQG